MPAYEDRLKDYVDVKERIRLFYEKYPDGRLTTDEPVATSEPDGTPRIWVKALAWRTADDPHPAEGWSWMVLPGSTNFTRGSEIENTQTSAWGRAIGALGIGIDKSIASANEVANKQDDKPETAASLNAKEKARLKAAWDADVKDAGLAKEDGSLIGSGELAKDFPDFLPRQGPSGSVLAFKLVSPSGGIKVIAQGALADVLPTIRDEIIGKRVSVWGHIRDEAFTPKGSKRAVTYQLLDLERIKTESGTLPMEEAPTAPLFEGPMFEGME